MLSAAKHPVLVDRSCHADHSCHAERSEASDLLIKNTRFFAVLRMTLCYRHRILRFTQNDMLYDKMVYVMTCSMTQWSM